MKGLALYSLAFCSIAFLRDDGSSALILSPSAVAARCLKVSPSSTVSKKEIRNQNFINGIAGCCFSNDRTSYEEKKDTVTWGQSFKQSIDINRSVVILLVLFLLFLIWNVPIAYCALHFADFVYLNT